MRVKAVARRKCRIERFLDITRIFLLLAFIISYISLATLAFAAEGESAVPPQKTFNAQTATLDNGLQIVLIENHRAPIVTQMVWYKVGGADEPPGKSGIAHMFEHLMFKGSKHVPPGEFSKKVRALGGNDNAFTSYDYTAYFQSIAADHLEEVMRMEADRMQGLDMPPNEFESEKKVVMEERRMRTDNDPSGAFYEQLGYSLFPHHPYGVPLIGWMREIAALGSDDAVTFYKKWYAPNNAVLVISGDITMAELLPMAKKYFGPLRANPELNAPRVRPQPADFTGQMRVTYSHPRIQQPQVVQIRRIPSVRLNKTDAYALEILEDIMGGGPTTRLYRALVVDQKIASNAGMSISNDSYDEGRGFVYATPLPGVPPETVQVALEQELRKVIAEGVTAEELKAAKDQITAQAVYALDSVTGPAMIFGRALTSGQSIDDVEYWVRDMQAITAADIQRAAKLYLDPDHTALPVVTGYLLPEGK